MITQLQIQNFKSWADTGRMRLAPLTGLFGANSSGKTSLLQFLLMLKQSIENEDRLRVLTLSNGRTLIDLGSFREVIHRHQLDAPLSFQLRWRPSKKLRLTALNVSAEEIEFEAEIRYREKPPRIGVDRFVYRCGGLEAGMEIDRARQPGDEYVLRANHPAMVSHPVRNDLLPYLPAPIRFYGFPREAYSYRGEFGDLQDLPLSLEQLFGRVFYLGPIRDYFKRTYQWSGETLRDIGQRGELTIPALLAARAVRQSPPTVEERVARWLKEMQLIEDFSVRPIAEHRDEYEVKVRQNRASAEVSISDVGFGVSQVLPVLVLCAYAPPGSILLLEQPELHLHPSVQYDLADVLIDAMHTRHIQIILESHSEHLLQRLQRRIAETDGLADQLALYFCESRGAASTLTPLRLDEFGNIGNWPPAFFGHEMEELTARAVAAADRQEQAARGQAQ